MVELLDKWWIRNDSEGSTYVLILCYGSPAEELVYNGKALWSCFETIHLSCFGSSCVSGTIFWYLMNHMWFSYRHEYYRYESNTSIKTFYEHYSIEELSSAVPKWQHCELLAWDNINTVQSVVRHTYYQVWCLDTLTIIIITWHVKCVLWLNKGKKYGRRGLKLSLCLKNTHGEQRFSSAVLDPSTRWGEWSTTCPRHFIPEERASGKHWIGSLVGPKTKLDTAEKRRIRCHRQELNYLSWPTYCGSLRKIIDLYVHWYYTKHNSSES
jgi:hypothetical protein